MGQRQDIDQLYGRVIGMLVSKNRCLDRSALVQIREDANKAVATSTVLWCDNLTAAISQQMVNTWEGRLSLNRNPS